MFPLSLCGSLEYMLSLAISRTCEQENNAHIHQPGTEGALALQPHRAGVQQLGKTNP